MALAVHLQNGASSLAHSPSLEYKNDFEQQSILNPFIECVMSLTPMCSQAPTDIKSVISQCRYNQRNSVDTLKTTEFGIQRQFLVTFNVMEHPQNKLVLVIYYVVATVNNWSIFYSLYSLY